MTKYEWPISDAAAAARYQTWKQKDPYPKIPPALLNSADIVDYVRTTGMLYPFREKKDGNNKLKTASYEVDLLGEYAWYDENGNLQAGHIAEGQEFRLRRNSIAFVQVEPVLRIPSYIALRFNLKITHVYRGLLLGTGPLIDPEYEGPLFIPLHNLTDHDYVFRGGEGLIWMEFTKLSVSSQWTSPDNGVIEQHGTLYEFPPRKTQMRLIDFLRKADPQRPIRSSLPAEIARSTKSAEQAAESARKTRQRVEIGLVVGALAILIALTTLLWSTLSFVNDRARRIDDRLDRIEVRIESPGASSFIETQDSE